MAWTVGTLLRQRRRPTDRQVLGALTAGLAVAALGFTLGMHMCLNGTPVLQWLIPAACLSATLLFVRPSLSRRIACGVLIIVAVALPAQYSTEVHAGRYIGNPAVGSFQWYTPLTGLYRCRGGGGPDAPVCRP